MRSVRGRAPLKRAWYPSVATTQRSAVRMLGIGCLWCGGDSSFDDSCGVVGIRRLSHQTTFLYHMTTIAPAPKTLPYRGRAPLLLPGKATCRRVLMTSKGVVRKAAAMPAPAPALKDLSM